MAKRDSRTIRVSVSFIDDVLEKIIEHEKSRGRDNTSYAVATKILRTRIMQAGGIKNM